MAEALEALQRIANRSPARSLSSARAADRLRSARSCYDHLAGRLGVDVTEALIARGCLRTTRDGFKLTDAGESWLGSLGVDVGALRMQRRAFALRCLDWSERRPHVAGAVGASLMQLFLARGWVARRPRERALRITPAGEVALRHELGVEVAAAPLNPRAPELPSGS